MTDEDLRKTVADIRQASHDVDMVKSMLETAADEIERLTALAQSDALRKIAWQKLTEEMYDNEKTDADYEGAYNEIVQCARAAIAQSDAEPFKQCPICGKDEGHEHNDAEEPVAWRWRWHSDPSDVWNFAVNEFHSELMIIEPLYTARPQPGSGSTL